MATTRSMGRLPVSVVRLHGWPILSAPMVACMVAFVHPLRTDSVAVQRYRRLAANFTTDGSLANRSARNADFDVVGSSF